MSHNGSAVKEMEPEDKSRNGLHFRSGGGGSSSNTSASESSECGDYCDSKETLEGKEEEIGQLPYPKSVFFIVSNEFCERFSYYGMRSILALYFNQVLDFTENTSTVFFHAFVALCYFTPVFGAVLADSFLGKFRTIFYISIIYAIGQITLTVGSLFEDVPATAISFIGLVLIAVGTGGIKPCVVSFGAEQFKLPEQETQMKTYFSLFYAAINSGSLISTVLTPVLRENVECNNQETCYPLAFGIPAALMIIAIFIFLGGRIGNKYKMILPKENIIVKTSKCIGHSYGQWKKKRKIESRKGVLDYGEEKYGQSFIDDVKAVLNVCYMFLPFPIFWALFDQQGSRWIFQARHMDGETFGYIILPDQMQVANPVLILLFIPLFEYGIYPLLAKLHLLKKPLQRIVTGGVLAALSFYVSGGLEMILEPGYPDLPTKGEQFHLTIYNGLPDGCSANLENVPLTFVPDDSSSNNMEFNFTFTSDFFSQHNVPISGKYVLSLPDIQCSDSWVVQFDPIEFRSLYTEKDQVAAMHLLISTDFNDQTKGIVNVGQHLDTFDKSEDGLPTVKCLWNLNFAHSAEFSIESPDETLTLKTNQTTGDLAMKKLEGIGDYHIYLTLDEGNRTLVGNKTLLIGANYQIVFLDNNVVKIHQITKENDVHIFWILPQYIIMTAGEVMFSITGLHFAYTQAPETMRAVLQSAFTLTTGFGNLIDVIIISAFQGAFSSQSHEFFLFASLMILDMILLAYMSMRYKYVDGTH